MVVMFAFAAHVALAEPISRFRREDAIFTPRPFYPSIPVRHGVYHFVGSGSFILHVNADGTVSRVDVEHSTGAQTLDRSAISALSAWRFKPGRVKAVRIPVTFTVNSQPQKPSYVSPKSR
jgi:TonB family protein